MIVPFSMKVNFIAAIQKSTMLTLNNYIYLKLHFIIAIFAMQIYSAKRLLIYC